jgi:hypothetical protein
MGDGTNRTGLGKWNHRSRERVRKREATSSLAPPNIIVDVISFVIFK